MRKGWFAIRGVQDGDRTIDDQRKGLDSALIAARGKTVLDLGCAEGLIAAEFADAGAAHVLGAEAIERAVNVGRDQVRGKPVTILHHDLNGAAALHWISGLDFDVCLMLAILHKLREPRALLETVAKRLPELIVVRLPAETGHLIPADKIRKRQSACDVRAELWWLGYRLEAVTQGHFDEWTGHFVRRAV